MKQGGFRTQVSEVEKILGTLGLYGDRCHWPAYDQYGASSFRGKNHLEIWRFCFGNQLYDFKLSDDSLIQFRVNNFEPFEASYLYLECPFDEFISFDDFIKLQEAPEEEKDLIALQQEHDYYMGSLEIKDAVTPIRYDYNPTLYKAGRHPASHIHFGYSNEIRLGAKKILRPLSFLFFVIRQCYPDIWAQFTQNDRAEHLCRNIREHLDDIDAECWDKFDEWEMVLF